MSWRVLQGDCRELMRAMPDASVDSIVTDPPYDLTSIVKRFGKPGAAPCQHGTDGAYSRASRGFMGQTWDGSGVAFDVATWAEALRVLKPGGHLLAFGGTRTYHRMATAIEDAGFELRDQIAWIYGSGFPKSHNLDGEHAGWGTALKPAIEPIAVARKPLAGMVAANMAAHGVGALNIDACRVPHDDQLRAGSGTIPCRHDPAVPRGREGEASAARRYRDVGGTNIAALPGPRGGDALGRWPANVIHDGSDEVVALFPAQAGACAPASGPSHEGFNKSGSMSGHRNGMHGRKPAFHKDAGSAARFFYCAKASKADREEGCEDLPQSAAGQVSETSGQHITRRDEGYELPKRANVHPTVKPEALMRYSVRLVTPVGGTVLDPFCGSGSTGKAAVLEGMSFIGCELTPEYIPIAEARITAAVARKAEADRVADERHPDLFGAAA